MKKNQLKLGVLLSYASTGLNMIIQLIYTPVMIRLLGQSEYGLYTLVGSVVSYLSLFSLGFAGAYMRFYLRFEEVGDHKAVARLNGMFLSLFSLLSILALLCGMILSQFTPQIFGSKLTADELSKAELLMQILVVNIALTFPSSIFDSMVSAHEQFIFQRMLNLAGVVFNPLICLPLLLLGYGSVAVVLVTTIITVAKLLVNIWFCITKLHVRCDFHHFDFLLLKEIASFSFFLFINMIIDQINWSVDKFILGRVSGTGAVAVYGVGAQINSIVISFSTAISSVFAPRVNRIAAKGSDSMNHEFTRLFTKVGRWQFLILGLISSGFIVFGQYFITNIYATTEYALAYPVALLLVLPAMIPLIQNIGIEIQRAVNKHKVRSVVYLLMAITNVILSVPLAYKFGPVGSALGTAISFLVANGLIMNIYYHKAVGINIPYFWSNILSMAKGFILPAVSAFLIMAFIRFRGVLDFLVWCVVYTGLYILSFWRFGMNMNERDVILKPLKKFKKRH